MRRVYRPSASDPTRPANAARSLQRHATGTREAMHAALTEVAAAHNAGVEVGADGIHRAVLQRRRGRGPGPERFLVVAPACAGEKAHRSFETWYAQAIAARAAAEIEQLELLPS